MLKSCDNKEFCGSPEDQMARRGGKGGRGLKYILENCCC